MEWFGQPDTLVRMIRMKPAQVHAECGTQWKWAVEEVHRKVAADTAIRKVDACGVSGLLFIAIQSAIHCIQWNRRKQDGKTQTETNREHHRQIFRLR